MALEIRTAGLDEYLQGDANIHMLVMGEPKVGKTLSASFWPSPIFAECGNEVATLARRRKQYARIRSSDDMNALLTLLKQECTRPKADRRWATLVIDTLDGYQRTVMQEWVDRERAESFTGWAAWGYLDGKMQQLIEKVNNLGMHVIVNLHVKEREEGDEEKKFTVVGPHLKGDLKTQITGEFDLIGYMGTYYEAEGGERVQRRGIRWKATPKYPALGDRFGLLPEWTPITFTDEDYGAIFRHLMAGFEELEAAGANSETVLTLPTSGDRRGPVSPRELKGGPVKAAEDAVGERKAPKRGRPKKDKPEEPAAEPATGGASSAPPEPEAQPAEQPLDEQPAEAVPISPEQALANLSAAGLEPTVVSATPAAEAQASGTEQPAPGGPESADACGECGNTLGQADANYVRLSQIKFRKRLCANCYAAAKAAAKG